MSNEKLKQSLGFSDESGKKSILANFMPDMQTPNSKIHKEESSTVKKFPHFDSGKPIENFNSFLKQAKQDHSRQKLNKSSNTQDFLPNADLHKLFPAF